METKTKAWWLGHSAFRLESPSGKVIYIDPFLSGNPKTPDKFKKPDNIDYILLTHGHEDHVGDTLDLAKSTGCMVVAQVELSHLLKKHGLPEDQRIEFNKGGTVHFDDFSVTLVNANHSSSLAANMPARPVDWLYHLRMISVFTTSAIPIFSVTCNFTGSFMNRTSLPFQWVITTQWVRRKQQCAVK